MSPEPCPSPDIWLAWLESRLGPSERARWTIHLAVCPDCRGELAGWAEAVPGSVPPAASSSPLLPLAAAASLLVAAGLAVFWKKPQDPPPTSVASRDSRKVASLELAPGGDAILSGRILIVKAGTCWLDTSVAVEMTEPCAGRFEAGSEAEIRILPHPGQAAWSLLGEAWAGTSPEVLVSVVSGSAITRDVRIPAGSRARLRPGSPPVLEPLDAAGIDAWRAKRLEAGRTGPERTLKDADFASFAGKDSFSAEVRAVQGYVVLRYPAGETTLGDLEAWKGDAWHRLSATWKGSCTEIFLDGRRLLKIPGSDGAGIPGLGVRGGTLVLREIRP